MSVTLSPFIQVYTKASKWNPTPQPTEYSVAIEAGKRITVWKNGQLANQFLVGDEATYDSWNLIYTGRITKITPKVVQITAYPGTQNERKYNLNLYKFCYKNWNFNADEVRQHNQETSYWI